ncbi:response regulator [Labilibacter sediminis]|nr:response regulator [Labilibacter sediminis]
MMDDKKHNILYVDDEESNIRIFKNTFRRHYNIHTALTGKEGLQILDEKRIDLIITDQRMPGMSGLEFLKKAVHKYPELNRILITAYSDYDVLHRAINEAQIFQYIEKPWDQKDVETIIEHALEVHRLRQEKEQLTSDLKESEEKFREMAENINDVFWLKTENKILYISPSFEKIWGITSEKMYNNLHFFIHGIQPEDEQKMKEVLHSNEYLEKGIFDKEYRILNTDHEIRWIRARSFPIYDENKTVVRQAGIASDITRQKEAEMGLIKAKEKAEENDQLKSAFLANMSHEIRTPMNGIIGFTELLSNIDVSNEEQKYYISIINECCHQLLTIVGDILDFSKIETGQVELHKKYHNIEKLLNESYNFFSQQASDKNIQLSYQIDLEDEKPEIFTDKSLFTQILNNLLCNAIKFTDEGSVNFGCKKQKDKLIFYISDTGIGIPQDLTKKIFERFLRVRSKKAQQYRGTGLGLSIVKGYIDLLGGKIWLESILNKGTTFYFTIT